MAVNIPIGADTKEFERSVRQVIDKTEKWLRGHSGTKNVALATAADQAKNLLRDMDKLQRKQDALANQKFPTEQYTQRINKLKEEQKLYEQLAKQRDKLESQRGPTAQYSSTLQQYQDALKEYERMEREFGKSGGIFEQAQAWTDLNEKVGQTTQALEDAQQRLADLESGSGVVDTSRLKALQEERRAAQQKIQDMIFSGSPDSAEMTAAYAAEAELHRQVDEEEQRVNMAIWQQGQDIAATRDEIAQYTADLAAMEAQCVENEDSFWRVAEALQSWEAQGDVVDNLAADLTQMRDAGEDNVLAHPEEVEATNVQLNETAQRIDAINAELEQMRASGEDSILGSETAEFEKGEQQISRLSNKIAILYGRMRNLSFTSIAQPLKKIFGSLNGVVNKLFGLVVKFGSKIGGVFKNLLGRVKETNKSFKLTLKNLIALGLGLVGLRQIASRLTAMLREGFNNLVGANIHNLKNEMKELKSEMLQMTNALAASFEPAIQAIIPYIQQLVGWITTLIDKFAQLVAAMFGQTRYVKALKKNIDDLGGSAQKALAPFDELNVLSKPSGTDYSGMFTEADVTQPMADLAQKIKDLAKTLFAPIKTAWDLAGDYVIRAWQHVTSSLKGLFLDIWKDFITVWQQPRTMLIFEHIIRAAGNLLDFVGYIADRFRDAWNLDDTGLKILEHIRNIIEIIAKWIDKITKSWSDWASELNFSPLLTAIERFLEDMEPHIDSLLSMFSDFHTQVLQPLAKWTLEKGLPSLFDVLDRILNSIDWEKLQSNLSELWTHLEPFAEKVGEGLLLFIEDVGTAIADFINGDSFERFLTKLEEWMDNTTPEDIKDFAESVAKIAGAIVALKAAFTGLSALASVIAVFRQLGAIPWGAIGSGISGLASGVSGLFSGFGGLGGLLTMDLSAAFAGTGGLAATATAFCTSLLGAIAAAWGGFEFGKWLGELMFPDDAEFYQDFHWFGEGGFFDINTEDVAGALSLIGQDIAAYTSEWWSGVSEGWNMMWEGIGSSISEWWSGVETGWATLWSWITTSFNSIVTSVSTAVSQIIAFCQGLWTTVSGFFSNLWTDIETVWAMVAGWFDTNVIQPIVGFFQSVWTDVSGFFNDLWTDIQTTWGVVADWFNTNVIQPITGFFSDLWTNITNGVKDAINYAVGSIQTFLNGVINAINKFTSGLSSVATVAAAVTGTSYGTISQISQVTLPKLAAGAVIPPNKEFMAILGDQKSETNVEAPLSTIQEALVGALQQIGGLGGDSQPINIYLGTDLIYSEIKKLEKRNAIMGG